MNRKEKRFIEKMGRSEIYGKLNVAIADDNEKMVEVLGQIIEEDKDLELVGKAHNGEEICNIIRERNRTLWFWILLCRKWTDWQ